MSILSELKIAAIAAHIPAETAAFTEPAPDCYLILTPIVDTYPLFVDNAPLVDVNEVRCSLYCRGNYLETKAALETELLSAGFTITDRRYIGYESDTKYHHIAIDVAKHYNI